MRLGPGEVMASLWAGNVAGAAPGRYQSVYISVPIGFTPGRRLVAPSPGHRGRAENSRSGSTRPRGARIGDFSSDATLRSAHMHSRRSARWAVPVAGAAARRRPGGAAWLLRVRQLPGQGRDGEDLPVHAGVVLQAE